MNYTANLNLKKPERTDFYNIDDFNDNADTLDSKAAEIETKLNNIATVESEILTINVD